MMTDDLKPRERESASKLAEVCRRVDREIATARGPISRIGLDDSIAKVADICRGAIYDLEVVQIDLKNFDLGL